jgi:soluble lytic murein transglycosylase-like protein
MTKPVDKDSLPLDKPRRTPGHPTKSHVVKTKVDGREKIIRFGEQGAETAGKPKAGESDRMKQKRASFKARHAQNIAKGKSSPAYWADKVKWNEGGMVKMAAGGGVRLPRAEGAALQLIEQMRRAGGQEEFNPVLVSMREQQRARPARRPQAAPQMAPQAAAPLTAMQAPQTREEALPLPPTPPAMRPDENPPPEAPRNPMRFDEGNPHVATAIRMAERYGLPPSIFLSLVQQESRFNPAAVSPRGAIGLGQLMPATARELGVDPRDPEQNLEGSARYLRRMLDQFGNMELALAAYNAGPGRVRQAGNTIPNNRETQAYVPSVLRRAGVQQGEFAKGGLAELDHKYAEGGAAGSGDEGGGEESGGGESEGKSGVESMSVSDFGSTPQGVSNTDKTGFSEVAEEAPEQAPQFSTFSAAFPGLSAMGRIAQSAVRGEAPPELTEQEAFGLVNSAIGGPVGMVGAGLTSLASAIFGGPTGPAGEGLNTASGADYFNPYVTLPNPTDLNALDRKYAEGGRVRRVAGAIGRAVRGRDPEVVERALPPVENSRLTQVATTGGTYEKARDVLRDKGVDGPVIDYGAGRGHGTAILGGDSFEPYPGANFRPTYTNPSEIPDDSYAGLVNLNVLNVLPPDVRDDVVRNIGRVLEPQGTAVITTRGRDVMSARGTPGPEPMSLVIGEGDRARYQKGFTPAELREYLQRVLGPRFDVENLDLGPAGALVRRLYGAAPAGAIGAGAALSDDETRNLEDLDQKYAEGGRVRRVAGAVARAVRGRREPETPPMIAMHNTRPERLERMAEREGVAVAPSIAISRADDPTTSFGDVSLMVSPETINPSRTPVYARDAYTPRYPNVETRNVRGEDREVIRVMNENTGEWRSLPHTPENALRVMRREPWRGGEDFITDNWLLAQLAPQFRNMSELRTARSRLVPATDTAVADWTKGLDDLRSEWSRVLSESGQPADWRFADSLQRNLAEAANRRDGMAYINRAYYNNAIPEDLLARTQAHLDVGRELPSTYFEAKPTRLVPLSEFEGAVVPSQAPQDLTDLLRRYGIEDIQYYASPEQRAEQVRRFERLLFGGAPVAAGAALAAEGAEPEPQRYAEGGAVMSDEEYDRRLLSRMKAQTGRVTEPTRAEQMQALRTAGRSAAEGLADVLLPQSPLDVALMAAFGPGGRAARLAGSAALASLEPSEAEASRLRAAIRAGRRIYASDGTHLDALLMVPEAERGAAMLDSRTRGFVDDRGRFMDRRRAQNFALENDLFRPDAPSYAKTSPELISEFLRQDNPLIRRADGGLADLDQKYAEGGIVSAEAAKYDPDAVDALVKQIEAEYV